MISFILNQENIETELPPGMTVLDFVRYFKNLKGTKIGCREGDCGACTILVGEMHDQEIQYQTMTSCLMPLQNAAGKHIVTIEGINNSDGTLTPAQKVLTDANGTQCGFCTVGFVMSLTSFCLNAKDGSQQEAIAAIDGNICRCTGYKSIERAASNLCLLMNQRNQQHSHSFSIEKGIVPSWFNDIGNRLSKIHPQHADEVSHSSALVMGGGTDLYVQSSEALLHQSLEFVFDQYAYQDIIEQEDRIEIGGAVTVTALMESTLLQYYFPQLRAILKLVSSTPIRNMATVGGNIVNASPIGDITIMLLALDATMVLKGEVDREIQLRDFYQGYKVMDKKPGEIVKKIFFKKPGNGFWFNFEKVSKRQHLDIATVNTAIALHVQDNSIVEAHISAGGVAPIPLYLKNTSSCLLHQTLPLKEEQEKELLFLLQSEVHPISDVRGSAAYKRLLLQQLFRAHFVAYQNFHAKH